MKKHLTRLYVVRFDGSTGCYISNDNAHSLATGYKEGGIKKLEQNVLGGSENQKWEIAYLYDAMLPSPSPPIHAYHHSRGWSRLTKKEAEELRFFDKNKSLGNYRAYVIPNDEAQQAGRKPTTHEIEDPDHARRFFRDDTYKIQVYDRFGSLIKTYFLNPLEGYYYQEV